MNFFNWKLQARLHDLYIRNSKRSNVILENELIDRWINLEGFVLKTRRKALLFRNFLCDKVQTYYSRKKNRIEREDRYSRNVIDVDWGLVVKLALPGKVTRRAYKVHIWNL
jgi:hypothetical protein